MQAVIRGAVSVSRGFILSQHQRRMLSSSVRDSTVQRLRSSSRLQRTLNFIRSLLFRHLRLNQSPSAVDSLRISKSLSHLKNIRRPGGRFRFVFPDQAAPVARWARIASRRLLVGSGGVTIALVGLTIPSEGENILSPKDNKDWIFDAIRCHSSFQWINHFPPRESFDSDKLSVQNFRFNKPISKGCNGVIYDATILPPIVAEEKTVAVKMLFNYEAETNASAVFNAMRRECVIFPGRFGEGLTSLSFDQSKIKEHPCIAEVNAVFTDETPLLPEALTLYPHALPQRLYEAGFGRNMTLFIVMKKYDMSLRDLITSSTIETRTSVKILTQAFEAISYLEDSKIAHRDIKSDNFLVDIRHGYRNPIVVLTDFGCCSTTLRVYYPSPEISKGGNLALMPPEVVNAQPGPFSYIEYHRADLWSLGCVAYEIFQMVNPFYGSKTFARLNSSTYTENQLPTLPPKVPKSLKKLHTDIMKRDPSLRPSARVSATVTHIILSAKSKKNDIMDTLDEVMLRDYLDKSMSLEKKLRQLFLTQVASADMDSALSYFM